MFVYNNNSFVYKKNYIRWYRVISPLINIHPRRCGRYDCVTTFTFAKTVGNKILKNVVFFHWFMRFFVYIWCRIFGSNKPNQPGNEIKQFPFLNSTMAYSHTKIIFSCLCSWVHVLILIVIIYLDFYSFYCISRYNSLFTTFFEICDVCVRRNCGSIDP